MNWIIIVAVIVLLLILFKAKEVRHKIGVFVILGIVLFVAFTFTQLENLSGKNLDLNSFEGLVGATKLYLIWLKQAFLNVMTITGNALKLDWSINMTNFTK